jgi:hypothetical protein
MSKEIASGTPIKAGAFGYYKVAGRQVPIQKNGCPFTDVTCVGCKNPAPYPLEFGGFLFCSDWCAKKKLGDHPNLNSDPEYWKRAERVEMSRAKLAAARAELAKEGIIL